jgi:flagellar M-ring protein FliF
MPVAFTRIKDLWRNLEPRGQLTIVGSALLVFVTFYLLYSLSSKTSYEMLVSGVDPAQTGQMTTALSSAGVVYKIANGGTEIDVPSGSMSEARIALASKGLTNGGQVGFEIFDKMSMGTTDFQQKIDYQRALEGEVDRAIQQINGITNADVQLVLPDDTLFVDQSSKASASVLLTTAGQLDPSTVSGIAHLVASAVKGLDTGNVTITDQTGELLWPDPNATGGVNAGTKLAADQLYASSLASQINAMLTSTLGAGKAQARVNADLNVNQQTIDATTYAKKGTALSTQTSDEKLKSSGGSPVLPAGTSSNTTTTPTYSASGSGNSTSNYQNKSGTTNYGVDKTVSKTTVAPGSVNRVNVALLIDSSVPAAEVASLKQSVASIAGINTKRGDTLAVSRIAFASQNTTTPTSSSPIAMLGNPLALAKWFGLGLATLLFLFFVRRGLKRREAEGIAPEPTWLREIQRSVPVAELTAAPLPERPALDPAQARREALKAEAEQIAEKQPEQIAIQVAEWLKE